MRVEPYVYFQGRCEEALEFYRGAIDADATVFARFEDKVAHAVLRVGDTVVLASDGQGSGQAEFSGFSMRCRMGEACRSRWHRRRSRRASAWSPTSSVCRGWSCHRMRRGDLPI